MPIDIFISYRRLDSAIFSQWLATQLQGAYGVGSVFIDTETIRDADAWAAKIASSLNAASVFIVVIGKSWLSIKDECERRRIDLPDDWVRREIETALPTQKTIIPLLIEGAALPSREALPPSLIPLLAIEPRRIGNIGMAAEILELVRDIGKRLGKKPNTAEIQYPFPLLKIKPLDEENLQRLQSKLPAWRLVSRVHGSAEKTELMRTYEFESFYDAVHFMNTAARFIDRIDHHPEWTNVWRTLVVYLTTWDIGHKPSMLDVDLAAYLDDLYGEYERKISRRDMAAAGITNSAATGQATGS
jgi:pterin-4a-carbinolamine dehydratase